ncbi:hypothetical protein ZIOFF_018089 [Zingiber officinale]|uniref:Uncharacterized protein n=1 Tax=Zingiber officinale TaxID=94328 RepID=A0A8J5LKJ0_ZINOF|nr:hypothetical protein ZIOFF_018089 [Zingiber officinale]
MMASVFSSDRFVDHAGKIVACARRIKSTNQRRYTSLSSSEAARDIRPYQILRHFYSSANELAVQPVGAMARKGFWRVLPRKYFSHHRRVDDSSSSSSSSEEASKLVEKVARAEVIMVKWDPDSSAYANVTSLFHEDRLEA